jgi:hypothetical protein
VINIFDKYKEKGIGTKSFYKLFDGFGGKEKIKGIIGSWHSGNEFNHLENNMSTNLLLFKKYMHDGFSEQESSKMTPTGKWAGKLGYKDVQIILNTDDRAEVLFF